MCPRKGAGTYAWTVDANNGDPVTLTANNHYLYSSREKTIKSLNLVRAEL